MNSCFSIQNNEHHLDKPCSSTEVFFGFYKSDCAKCFVLLSVSIRVGKMLFP